MADIRISVKIRDVKNAGTDDDIYIVLAGPKGYTGKIKLNNEGKDDFKKGKTSVFDISAVGDIGVPSAIKLFLEGNDAVYIDSVQVEYKENKNTQTSICNFSFNGALGKKGDFNLTEDRKSVALGDCYPCYKISVKIKDVENAGTDDDIYIALFGPKGSIDMVQLDNEGKDDFQRGKTSVFDFEVGMSPVHDIGLSSAIILFLKGDDAVYIETVQVEYKKNENTKEIKDFPFNGVLGNKGDLDISETRKCVALGVIKATDQIEGFVGIEEDNELKNNILQKCAPMVWLAKEEKFFPSSVDWAFPYLERYKNEDEDGKYCLRTKESLSDPSDWHLEVFKGNLESACVYAFWVDKNDKVDLVYFMYYPYNRGKEVASTIFGNHVGDWEHITVRLQKIMYGNQKLFWPIQVYYPYHSSGKEYLWKDIDKADNTHPIVYSAWGSHGMWKNTGSHKYDEIMGTKNLYDECSQGTRWNTWENIRTFYYNAQACLNTQWPEWPAWMSTDYTKDGNGDPSVPGHGPIYRWGNPRRGKVDTKLFGVYYRLEKGPTGPAGKNVWNSDKFK